MCLVTFFTLSHASHINNTRLRYTVAIPESHLILVYGVHSPFITCSLVTSVLLILIFFSPFYYLYKMTYTRKKAPFFLHKTLKCRSVYSNDKPKFTGLNLILYVFFFLSLNLDLSTFSFISLFLT